MSTPDGLKFMRLIEDATRRVHEISADDVKAKLDRGDDFILIDVREDHEWAKGHLPRAIHLARGIIERDIEVKVPDQRAEIVLYCARGLRSVLAADNLGKMGYMRVTSMTGGMGVWKERAFPVVAAEAK